MPTRKLSANDSQETMTTGHLTLQIRTRCRYFWGVMHESFLKASSVVAKYSFRIKSRTEENTGKISAEESCPAF